MDQLPGICWDAATRLFGCTQVHLAYAFKLKKNLISLQSKLGQLENIRKDVKVRIEEAESNAEMKRTNEVDGWLQDVQNFQQTIKDIEAEGCQEVHNTCLSGCCPINYVSSYKIGRKVVKQTIEVDELVTWGRRYLDKNVDIAHRLPSNLVDEMPSGEIVGLELMLNKVLNNLQDKNVGIIGLYGMGGAGKTTLMKRIHNELGKKEHEFELVLWAVVSKDCNIDKVMNDIRKRIGIENDFWDTNSEEQRVAKIYKVLKKKRFVLMLDDLWGKLELEKVGVPHPKKTNCHSKVVLTTRFEDVCVKMQADAKFKVECLLEKEAFDLFCEKVGKETLTCHREIPKLAWEMAKECGRLPLALITVGSAMAGVKSIEAWRQANSDLRSSPLIGPDLEEKVFSILKFSYDRLPDEAHKHCFLYCALYPEDYPIGVEGLIDRWIGEGFLGKGRYMRKRSIHEMREEGHSIIEKLKLSSLLEDSTNFEYASSFYITKIYAVKMHDVIRDMALWLARDQDENKDKVVVQREAFQIDYERFNVVERISVIGVKEKTWQLPICPNLLTLCAQGSLEITQFSNFQCMTRLKVLNLSVNFNICYFPAEIGKLINLEFLNLSNMSELDTLPIELKNLNKLKVFIMEDTVTVIPLDMFEGLKRLQVFRYSGCRVTKQREEILLEKFESLPELEELGVYLETITGMHKLLDSNKLQGCLRRFEVGGIKERLEMASLMASWSTMKHLESIGLFRLGDIREVSSITHTCHLDRLRELAIVGCHSITHLTWLRYAPLLESLNVSDCDLMEEMVKGGQDEEDDVGIDLFSNLRFLVLEYLPKLNSIHKRALSFPSLKSIYIYQCDNLRKLPLNSNSAKDTLNSIRGFSEWWSNLEWEDPAAEDLFHSKFQPFGS